MIFEWDDAKNLANIDKHGISFSDAIAVFDGPIVTIVDDRFAYGEVRQITTGMMSGTLIVTLVHTDRRGRCRLISARRASPRERKRYESSI